MIESNYGKVFHVHVDPFSYVIGCILVHFGDKNMDFLVCYAVRQLNTAERNYSTIEREGLRMIFEVQNYRHYLLANKFVFFTNHQALLYLVKKPCNTGMIVIWFLILLEFDFTVIVK